MTKKVINLAIFLFLLISVETLFAQEKKGKENIFGILLGGTFSEISNYNGKIKSGIIGGLYWEWKFSENFSYMSNILYSQRGEKGKDNLSEIKLAYLNTPFAIKYSISKKLGVSTGINWDLLLSVDGENVNKDNFKKSDWGIPFGVSYNISNNLQFRVIYVYGLTDITKNVTVKMKNNWGNISLAYLFK